nr:ribonuclease HII [Bifidobacterium myosotis]
MITPTLDMERRLAADGYDLIVGFDEVGRGALAGPVMVGCAAIWARDLEPLSSEDDGDDDSCDTGDGGDSSDHGANHAAHGGDATGAAGFDGVTEIADNDSGSHDEPPAPGRRFLTVPDGVADSKLLTEHRREAIFDELRDWCAAYAVGGASNNEIDEWGITYALGVASLRALADVERQLGVGAERAARAACADGPIRVAAILDGPSDYITKALGTFDAPDVPVPARVTTKVKGDRHCATVATAAVIAKVTRDRLMVDIAHDNPQYAPYQWDHNKGYGSAAHRSAIAELGPTPLHRLSWHLT